VAAAPSDSEPLELDLTTITDLSQTPLEEVSLRQQQAAIDRWIDTAVSHRHSAAGSVATNASPGEGSCLRPRPATATLPGS
jgi:hypothetical protein